MGIVTRFNLRVYALIFRDNRILLSDESISGHHFTKFPGGGVEPGEGILDALNRELMEEGDITILQTQHFYTTDFFQISAFSDNEQIVSVYYMVKANFDWNQRESDQSQLGKQHRVRLYFKALSELEQDSLTFPIDRKVLEMIKSQWD